MSKLNRLRIASTRLGDDEKTWDPGDEQAVATIQQEIFDKIRDGYLAYELQQDNNVALGGEDISWNLLTQKDVDLVLMLPMSGG